MADLEVADSLDVAGVICLWAVMFCLWAVMFCLWAGAVLGAVKGLGEAGFLVCALVCATDFAMDCVLGCPLSCLCGCLLGCLFWAVALLGAFLEVESGELFIGYFLCYFLFRLFLFHLFLNRLFLNRLFLNPGQLLCLPAVFATAVVGFI